MFTILRYSHLARLLMLVVLVVTGVISISLVRANNKRAIATEVLAIANSVSGDYSGQATLQGVYSGTWISKSVIADKDKMDLGYIDLAFSLTPSVNNVIGNVILSRTLVFSATEGNIAVTGQMNGNNLHLESSQFTMRMNEARVIGGEQVAPERIVTRQFSLDTEQILNDGATLLGTYRETIWGYAPEPVTVVGKFALERPIFGASSSSGRKTVYLPVIRR